MSEVETSIAECENLHQSASMNCDELISHCLAIHVKVDVLRRSIFRLDDLLHSLKSCCFQLHAHKMSSGEWDERIAKCLNEGTECDVTQKILDFNSITSEVYQLLSNRVQQLPAENPLLDFQQGVDKIVQAFETTCGSFENEQADGEIVERFTELIRVKKDIENSLGMGRSSRYSLSRASDVIDVVDVENWVPDNTRNGTNNSYFGGYNQPGKKRTTRNSSGATDEGSMMQFVNFRNEIYSEPARDGEGDHHSDSDYSDSSKGNARKGGKKGASSGANKKNRMSPAVASKFFKDGGLPSNNRKLGRQSTKKAPASSSEAVIKKKQQPPKQSNSLDGFIVNGSEAEEEEAEARRGYNNGNSRKRSSGSGDRSSGRRKHREDEDEGEDDAEFVEDIDEDEDNDGVVGIDNGSGSDHSPNNAAAVAEDEPFFPHQMIEMENRSAVRQATVDHRYGRKQSGNSSTSFGYVDPHNASKSGRRNSSGGRSVPDVVDLSMDLTQPSGVEQSWYPSPSHTPPHPHPPTDAAADTSPSRRLRSADQRLAAHDEAAAAQAAAGESTSVVYQTRSRSNSNVSNDSISPGRGGGKSKSGGGSGGTGNRSRSNTPPVQKQIYMSQDAEFDEQYVPGPTHTTTTATSSSVKSASAGHPVSSANVPVFMRPKALSSINGVPLTPDDRPTQSSGASHISPIPTNRLTDALAEPSDELMRELNNNDGAYWGKDIDDEVEEADEDGSISSLVITKDSKDQRPVSNNSSSSSSGAVFSTPQNRDQPSSGGGSFVSSVVGSFTSIFSSITGSGTKKRPADTSPVSSAAARAGESAACASHSASSSSREMRAAKRTRPAEDKLDEDEIQRAVAMIEEKHSALAGGSSSSSSSSSSSTAATKPVGVQYSSAAAAAVKSHSSNRPMRQDSIEDPSSGDEHEVQTEAHVKNNRSTNNNSSSSASGGASRGSGSLNSNGTLQLRPKSNTPTVSTAEGSAHEGGRLVFEERAAAKKTQDAPHPRFTGSRSSNRRGNNDVIDLC